MIRRRDLSVSAGNGLVAVEEGEVEALAFSRAWLLRQGINADLAVLVRVMGDSMEPTIPEGSIVLLHVPEMFVERPGIYAFNRGDSSYIKRLVPGGVRQRARPSSLTIKSDNPAYPDELVEGAAMNDIRVIGRVRCALITL